MGGLTYHDNPAWSACGCEMNGTEYAFPATLEVCECERQSRYQEGSIGDGGGTDDWSTIAVSLFETLATLPALVPRQNYYTSLFLPFSVAKLQIWVDGYWDIPVEQSMCPRLNAMYPTELRFLWWQGSQIAAFVFSLMFHLVHTFSVDLFQI